MERQARYFLKMWVSACVGFVLIVGILNILVDPYRLFGAPRLNGFNAHTPIDVADLPRTKAYNVLKANPNTLLVGASAVHAGFDENSPAWPAANRPIYNLALAGANLYASRRYLQHVLSQRHVGFVVIGLEFPYFLNMPIAKRPPDFESRLAVTFENDVNLKQPRQRIRDYMQAAITLDALSDSAATLSASFSGRESSSVVHDAAEQKWHRITRAEGSYPLINYINLLTMRGFPGIGRQKDAAARADLRGILDLCEAHGARVILFISPTRAEWLEVLDLMGYWQAFEDWKRELVAWSVEYPSEHGSSLIIWDFSGYNMYTTEHVQPDGTTIHWFWDTIHYTQALGQLMVERMFAESDQHFGVLLNSETIEPHLASIRDLRRLYRDERPTDVGRLRALYAAASTSSEARAR